jgi:hypothetical protein
MAVEPGGAFEISLYNNDFFTNSSNDDLQIRTMLERQRILIGTRSNADAAMMITSNTVMMNNNLFIYSKLGVGKSNLDTYPVDIIGNTAIDGSVNTTKHILCRGVQLRRKTGSYYSTSNLPSGLVQGFSNDNTDTDNGLTFYINSNTSTNYFRYLSAGNEIARFTGDGKLGIGISNPSYNLYVEGDAFINSNMYIAGHILPNEDVEYDLGTSNMRFRDLYLSSNTIHIGSSKIRSTTDGGIALLSENDAQAPIVSSMMSLSNYGKIILYTSNNNLGIALSNPTCILEIGGNDAILIPKGTTGQRPTLPKQGQIRYNTSINTFEGYGAGNTWGSLGGIKDTNQDTYISAESFPTSNDDILRFFNSNNETLRITATGRIGISNQSPSERLEVNGGNAKFSSNVYVIGKISVGGSNPKESLDITGNILASQNIYSLGNIGIGTSNPMSRLEVNGLTRITSKLSVGSSNFKESLDITGNILASQNIYSLGNVGIGTSNLTNRLHVIGNSYIQGNVSTGHVLPLSNELYDLGGSNFRFRDLYLSSNTIYLGDGKIKKTAQGIALMDSNDRMTGNMAAMMMLSNNGFIELHTRSNNLGIGTQTPSEKLEVNGSARISSNLEVANNLNVQGNLTVTGSTFVMNTDTVEVKDNIIVLNSGQVGSGVSAGTAGITIDRGDAVDYQLLFNETTDKFEMGAAGNLIPIASETYVNARTYDASNITSGTLPVNRGGTGTTTSTGTGNVVLNASPTFSGTVTVNNITANGSISGSGSGISNINAANISSGTLAVIMGGTGTTTSTGTGNLVLSASPTFTGTVILPATTVNGDMTFGSGVNLLVNGADTATAPGYSWNGDTNTGMYRVSACNIGFSTGGVNRVTINNTGISGNGSQLTNLNANNISFGVLDVTVGGTGTTTSTGTGSVVLNNAPSITGQLVCSTDRIYFNTNNGNNCGLINRIGPMSILSETWLYFICDYNNNQGVSSEGFSWRTNNNDISLATEIMSLNGAGNLSVSGSISGDGSGLTSLNAANISSGTLAVTRGGTGTTTSTGSGDVVLSISPTFTGTVTLPVTTVNGDMTFGSGANLLGNNADSATAPSYSWNGDTNTGMFHATTDTIGFATGGVNRVTINSSGISGNGSQLTSLNADNISSGILEINRGGTGTTSSTGSGSVVLSASPTFTGTVNMPATNFNIGSQRFKVYSGGAQVGGDITDPITFEIKGSPPESFITHPGVAAYRFDLPSNGALYLHKWNQFTDSVVTTGNIFASSCDFQAKSYSTYSDDRIKRNETYIEDAINTLEKLRPQIYDKYIMQSGVIYESAQREAGLIAQEVFYDAPELRYIVSVPDSANSNIVYSSNVNSSDPSIDPDYSSWGAESAGINYICLIPYLIKAVQELSADIKVLKSRLDSMT